MTGQLNKIMEFFRMRLPRRSIGIEGTTLIAKNGQRPSRVIKLSEIREIYLVKTDNLTYEEEYIIFKMDNQKDLNITDEFEGFSSILDRIAEYGVSIDSNWKMILSEIKQGDYIKVL
jgi:hypothetical protein